MFCKLNRIVFFIFPFKNMEMINGSIFGEEGGLTLRSSRGNGGREFKYLLELSRQSGGEVPGWCWVWRECALPKGICGHSVPTDFLRNPILSHLPSSPRKLGIPIFYGNIWVLNVGKQFEIFFKTLCLKNKIFLWLTSSPGADSSDVT